MPDPPRDGDYFGLLNAPGTNFGLQGPPAAQVTPSNPSSISGLVNVAGGSNLHEPPASEPSGGQVQTRGSEPTAQTTPFSEPESGPEFLAPSADEPNVATVPASQSTTTSTPTVAADNIHQQTPQQSLPPVVVAATSTTGGSASAPINFRYSARQPFHPHSNGRASLWVEEARAYNQAPRWGCVHCNQGSGYTRSKTLMDHHQSQHSNHEYCPIRCCINNPHLPTPRALSQSLAAEYQDALSNGSSLPYVLAHRAEVAICRSPVRAVHLCVEVLEIQSTDEFTSFNQPDNDHIAIHKLNGLHTIEDEVEDEPSPAHVTIRLSTQLRLKGLVPPQHGQAPLRGAGD
ncbi:hypothetical protein FQN57_007365, partial [Myotisia sp. PD_48]